MSKVIFFCEGDHENEKSLDWQIFQKLFVVVKKSVLYICKK